MQVQFRYAFVTDARGLRVLDVTQLAKPRSWSRASTGRGRGDSTVARTYAYVPAGSQGLAIVDVERPTKPLLVQMFNAGGVLNDTRAVQRRARPTPASSPTSPTARTACASCS